MNGQNIKLAASVTDYTIDAVKKSEYEDSSEDIIYLDEIDGISKTYIETLGKSEIYTSEDFLDTSKADILTLKGFGVKTVDKVSAIIEKAVEKLRAEIKSKEEEKDTEKDSTVESVLDEVENN